MADAPSRTGAYLVALTPESAAAIQAREINIPHLPFRVGRESRRFKWTEMGLVGERRTVAAPNNAKPRKRTPTSGRCCATAGARPRLRTGCVSSMEAA